jgi:hypothetical protein
MRTASSLAGHTPSAEVTGVKNTREREKRDMQDLNERFAGYIEKVIVIVGLQYIQGAKTKNTKVWPDILQMCLSIIF